MFTLKSSGCHSVAATTGDGTAFTVRMREGYAGGGKGPLISEDKPLTLGCNNDQAVFAMQRFDEYKKSDISSSLKQRDYKDATDLVLEPQLYDMTHADEVMRPVEKGIAPTLNSRMGTGGNQVPVMLDKEPQVVAFGIGSYESNSMKSSNPYSGIYKADTARTLDLNGGNPACNQGGIAICLQGSMIGRADKNGPQGDGVNEEVSFTLNTTDRHEVALVDVAGLDCRNGKENGDLCGTLQAKANGGFSYNCTHPVRIGYAVRRLTPTECLRLQGFPDWWLDIEGASDTAKYKSIGNSVAIPCVDFVMSGIARVLRKENQCE